jgi:tRNA nucleotidyltransferase (CCA-adding enzyme)
MKLLAETGALKYVFPELCHTIGMPQNPKYHDSDVFGHILRVVKAAEKNYPGDIVMQLSAVFHDVAKGLPEIRGINKEGQPNDLGHEEAGIPIAEKALLRLQFGKILAKQVCFIVKFHGIKMDENPRRGSVVRQLRKMKPFFQDKSKLIEGVTKLFQFMDCDADGFDPAFGAEIKRVNATVFAMFEKVLSDTIFYRDEKAVDGMGDSWKEDWGSA